MVYFGDLLWRSVGQVGTGAVHVFENDTGPDDANHAHEGLYVLAGGGAAPGPGGERDIRDIAPTLLTAARRAGAQRDGGQEPGLRRTWCGAPFVTLPHHLRHERRATRAVFRNRLSRDRGGSGPSNQTRASLLEDAPEERAGPPEIRAREVAEREERRRE